MTDRYRMTFKCSECANVFKKITTNVNLENPPCPECKNKNKKMKQFKIGDGPIPSSETKEEFFQEQKVFPNTIYKCKDCSVIMKIFEEVGEAGLSECYSCGGHNIVFRGKISKDIASASTMQNKAVDYTADIVMEDYKITDLKDNVRQGESMAPKLDPAKQAAADNMFGGHRKKGLPFNAGKLAKQALAGGMRDNNYRDPVAALKPQYKPKTEYVNAITGVKN